MEDLLQNRYASVLDKVSNGWEVNNHLCPNVTDEVSNLFGINLPKIHLPKINLRKKGGSGRSGGKSKIGAFLKKIFIGDKDKRKGRRDGRNKRRTDKKGANNNNSDSDTNYSNSGGGYSDQESENGKVLGGVLTGVSAIAGLLQPKEKTYSNKNYQDRNPVQNNTSTSSNTMVFAVIGIAVLISIVLIIKNK